ncbi:hypothetical protein EC988_009553, partial [Linderina pennispora]
ISFARAAAMAAYTTNNHTPRVAASTSSTISVHEHSTGDDGLHEFAFNEDILMDRHYEKAMASHAARAATYGEVRVMPAAAHYHNVSEMHGE